MVEMYGGKMVKTVSRSVGRMFIIFPIYRPVPFLEVHRFTILPGIPDYRFIVFASSAYLQVYRFTILAYLPGPPFYFSAPAGLPFYRFYHFCVPAGLPIYNFTVLAHLPVFLAVIF